MASSVLTWRPRSYKEQPIFRALSFCHFIGPQARVIQNCRQTAPCSAPARRDQEPWVHYEDEISASYQEPALHQNTCKCAPGGCSLQKNSTKVSQQSCIQLASAHLAPVLEQSLQALGPAQTLTFRYCLCNVIACGTRARISTSTHPVNMSTRKTVMSF